jgi:hypothetical protein
MYDYPNKGVAMKRCFSLLPLVLAALVLASCDNTNHETTVINNSSHQIIFQWSKYDDRKIILNPQESIISEYIHADLFDLQPVKRVLQEYAQNTITVSNCPSWILRVDNRLSIPVTLSADGWMDIMENIPPGDTNDQAHTNVIFTDKPIFSVVTDSFPAAAQYQIIDNVMYVTIK